MTPSDPMEIVGNLSTYMSRVLQACHTLQELTRVLAGLTSQVEPAGVRLAVAATKAQDGPGGAQGRRLAQGTQACLIVLQELAAAERATVKARALLQIIADSLAPGVVDSCQKEEHHHEGSD